TIFVGRHIELTSTRATTQSGATAEAPSMSPLTRVIPQSCHSRRSPVSLETAEFTKRFAQFALVLRWRSVCSACRQPVVVAGALLTCESERTGDEETREPSLQDRPDRNRWLRRGQLRVAAGPRAGRHRS